jgi:hypothetical protein
MGLDSEQSENAQGPGFFRAQPLSSTEQIHFLSFFLVCAADPTFAASAISSLDETGS